jgi:hypothetical protein
MESLSDETLEIFYLNDNEQIVPELHLFKSTNIIRVKTQQEKLDEYEQNIKDIKQQIILPNYIRLHKKLYKPPVKIDKSEWFYKYSFCCNFCGVRNCLVCDNNCHSCGNIISNELKLMKPSNRASLKEKQTNLWSYNFGIECSINKSVVCLKCADVCFKCNKIISPEFYNIVEINNKYYGFCNDCNMSIISIDTL